MSRKGRPALGELKPGQDVIVVRSPNDQRNRQPDDIRLPAKVIKVARVWVTLGDPRKPDWSIYRWKMRMDTQDEGSDFSGSNARFVTIEQNEWEETRAWAQGVLREAGVDIRSGSPWAGREVELADFIATRKEEQA